MIVEYFKFLCTLNIVITMTKHRYRLTWGRHCLVLGFELCNSFLCGLQGITIFAHNLKGDGVNSDSSPERRIAYYKECDLTSSTSPGVIISGGDSMMLSPATLISIPRFSHSTPNIEPTPEITNQDLLNYPSQSHFPRYFYCSDDLFW